MSSKRKHSLLFSIVLVPVTLIILGAFALSGASVLENLRFSNATAQILGFVRTVRAFVNEQKTYTPAVGEDIWATLSRIQRIPSSMHQTNPWGGTIRTLATTSTEMDVESDLPSQDCRRMALYFLGLGPAELGLLSIAAKADQNTKWSVIYPSNTNSPTALVEASCGPTKTSRIALVFKIK